MRDEIQAHYKKRNNGSIDLMEKGIDLLNELIDLADGTCPLNYQERFTFIKQNYKTLRRFDSWMNYLKKRKRSLLFALLWNQENLNYSTMPHMYCLLKVRY